VVIEKNADLVWPPPPNPVKAEYLGEIAEFVPTGKTLKSIIFGKEDSGKIVKPIAIAVGEDGRYAIADGDKGGVHYYVPQKQEYKFLKEFGRKQLVSPVSVAFDDNLRLFVSDSALGKVLVYDNKGAYIFEIGAAGTSPLKRPTGVVYQNKYNLLYVVDTLAHKFHIYNSGERYMRSIGLRGIHNGGFNMPTHIAADIQGRIFINDAMNFRMQVFSPDGEFIAKFGNHGDGSGDFAMPKGVAVDRWGAILVAETLFDLIQVFNIRGEYLMTIGSKGTEPGQFWMPSGLFVDRNNKLYVCDTYNKRIQLFQLKDVSSGGLE